MTTTPPISYYQFAGLVKNSNSEWAIALADKAPVLSQNKANPNYNKPDLAFVMKEIDKTTYNVRLVKAPTVKPGADGKIADAEVEAYLNNNALYQQYLAEKATSTPEEEPYTDGGYGG